MPYNAYRADEQRAIYRIATIGDVASPLLRLMILRFSISLRNSTKKIISISYLPAPLKSMIVSLSPLDTPFYCRLYLLKLCALRFKS